MIRWLRRIAGALVIIAASDCNDAMWTFEPSADQIPLDAIVAVSRRPAGTLRADTVSTDTILARIPEKADTRIIDFTTTIGWFDQTAHARELKVRAVRENDSDSFLTARIVLRSEPLAAGSVVDTATVRAALGDYSAVIRIPLVR